MSLWCVCPVVCGSPSRAFGSVCGPKATFPSTAVPRFPGPAGDGKYVPPQTHKSSSPSSTQVLLWLFSEALSHPPSLLLCAVCAMWCSNCWSQPDSREFQVRGLNYMNDKVKVPSLQAAYNLLGVDLLLSDTKVHLLTHPPTHILSIHPSIPRLGDDSTQLAGSPSLFTA